MYLILNLKLCRFVWWSIFFLWTFFSKRKKSLSLAFWNILQFHHTRSITYTNTLGEERALLIQINFLKDMMFEFWDKPWYATLWMNLEVYRVPQGSSTHSRNGCLWNFEGKLCVLDDSNVLSRLDSKISFNCNTLEVLPRIGSTNELGTL